MFKAACSFSLCQSHVINSIVYTLKNGVKPQAINQSIQIKNNWFIRGVCHFQTYLNWLNILNSFSHTVTDDFRHLCSRRLMKILLQFNPFPHTTILHKTTLNLFCQKIENLHNWMDNPWQKVENIVTKGKLHVLCNFFFCHCFQKAICCRGVRKCLYEEKG